MSRFFDHVITADSHTRQHFPPKRSTVLANYPPLKFADVARRAAEDGVFRLVYAGGIDIDRGVGKVIDAVDLLDSVAVEFHVAGPPPRDALARRLGEHPKVVYHGMLPWEEVNALLVDADLGVVLLQPVPAYIYCPGENVIKLFEYMAVGLPVLISDFPKLKALIDSLGCGLAVDATSPQAIAAAIEHLYRNPSLRRQMSEAGREAVRDRCNWEHEEQKLLGIYRRLLGDKAGNAGMAGR